MMMIHLPLGFSWLRSLSVGSLLEHRAPTNQSIGRSMGQGGGREESTHRFVCIEDKKHTEVQTGTRNTIRCLTECEFLGTSWIRCCCCCCGPMMCGWCRCRWRPGDDACEPALKPHILTPSLLQARSARGTGRVNRTARDWVSRDSKNRQPSSSPQQPASN